MVTFHEYRKWSMILELGPYTCCSAMHGNHRNVIALLFCLSMAIASFSSAYQPFLSELLATFLPIDPLPLLLRAFRATELLAGAFDIKKVSALRVRAGSKVARSEKLPFQDRI